MLIYYGVDRVDVHWEADGITRTGALLRFPEVGLHARLDTRMCESRRT